MNFFKKPRYLFTIILPLFLFIFIAVNVVCNNTNSFDGYIYQVVSGYFSPLLTEVVKLITFFGEFEFLFVISLLLIVAFYKNEKYSFHTSMIIINLIIGELLNLAAKYIFLRERPDILKLINIKGYSFPSGHSMISMIFYGFLIYLCYKNYKTSWKYLVISAIALFILSIGLSRIYLGVHYASDVIGGFLFGILWLGIFSVIVEIRYKSVKTVK